MRTTKTPQQNPEIIVESTYKILELIKIKKVFPEVRQLVELLKKGDLTVVNDFLEKPENIQAHLRDLADEVSLLAANIKLTMQQNNNNTP